MHAPLVRRGDEGHAGGEASKRKRQQEAAYGGYPPDEGVVADRWHDRAPAQTTTGGVVVVVVVLLRIADKGTEEAGAATWTASPHLLTTRLSANRPELAESRHDPVEADRERPGARCHHELGGGVLLGRDPVACPGTRDLYQVSAAGHDVPDRR